MTAIESEASGRRDGVWAKSYTLSSGHTQFHQLGHVRLWITLLDQEWQIRTETIERGGEPTGWLEYIAHTLPSTDVPLQRFIRSGKADTVTLIPAMAPKPTVIRPYQPLTIPAGEQCVIYVGTLIWMKVCVGEAQAVLAEVPLAVPSMTWVGRNTMEGELCYSSASVARLVLEAVPKRPWRAITPVTIINRRESPLLLERFSLPTPMLSLHLNERGQLWTPGVTVVCETDMNSASLKVDRTLMPVAGNCHQIGSARDKVIRGRFIRTFDRIFG